LIPMIECTSFIGAMVHPPEEIGNFDTE